MFFKWPVSLLGHFSVNLVACQRWQSISDNCMIWFFEILSSFLEKGGLYWHLINTGKLPCGKSYSQIQFHLLGVNFISTRKSSAPAVLVWLFRFLEDRVHFDFKLFYVNLPINTKDPVSFCKEWWGEKKKLCCVRITRNALLHNDLPGKRELLPKMLRHKQRVLSAQENKCYYVCMVSFQGCGKY